MEKSAIVISGYLHGLSDNILPFLSKNIDLYVHTWKGKGNDRWISKLNRYKSLVNTLRVTVEEPVYYDSIRSLFHSTYIGYQMIDKPSQYNTIIKFKPDIDTDIIPYDFDVEKYYYEARLQFRPLLDKVEYKDCVFGRILHKTLDERIFTAHPNAWKTLFSKEYDTFIRSINSVNYELTSKHRSYEGSLLWTEYIQKSKLTLIQDTTLQLKNCKMNESYKHFD